MTRQPPFAPGQVWVTATERRRIIAVRPADRDLDMCVQYQVDGKPPMTLTRNSLRRWAQKSGAKLEGSDDA